MTNRDANMAPVGDPDSRIIGETVVHVRMLLLAELKAELDHIEVRAVLARNHRLTLRYNAPGHQPCGMTNPAMHVFTPMGLRKVTTDGTCFRLDSGEEFPVGHADEAATQITHAFLRHVPGVIARAISAAMTSRPTSG